MNTRTHACRDQGPFWKLRFYIWSTRFHTSFQAWMLGFHVCDILYLERQDLHLERYSISGKSGFILGEPCSTCEGTHSLHLFYKFSRLENQVLYWEVQVPYLYSKFSCGGSDNMREKVESTPRRPESVPESSDLIQECQVPCLEIEIPYMDFQFQPWRAGSVSQIFKRINFQFPNFLKLICLLTCLRSRYYAGSPISPPFSQLLFSILLRMN